MGIKIINSLSYVCSGNLVKEFEKYDTNEKKFKKYEGTNSLTKQKYSVDVGYEQFLGPESLFKPEYLDSKWKNSIDETIDNAIQSCPIDYRRRLYENIVLSGGTTLVKHFNDRLQKELQNRVDNRLDRYAKKTGQDPKKMTVKVGYNPYQQSSVWQGGSFIATRPNFPKMYHTRESYLEYGPSIARHNPVFSMGM